MVVNSLDVAIIQKETADIQKGSLTIKKPIESI